MSFFFNLSYNKIKNEGWYEVMIDNYVESHMIELQEKYSVYQSLRDYQMFPILCMKYFFFEEGDVPFDAEEILQYQTDGANDGGIDAIFNDPNSDENDVIIIQCKYYKNTTLTFDDISGGLKKIENTLKNLKNNKTDEYNEGLINAYREATGNMSDDGEIKIYFFTMFQPKNKHVANKLAKAIPNSFLYEVEIEYRKDIEDQIEICDNGKNYVESDKLKIDKKDNYLQYNDSIIVNISAKSLSDLYNKRKNGLLGMNLRYYIKQKMVDNGIQKTINTSPDTFWYKNNGIVIVCEDYLLDGTEVKLYNFSIINGGQTTNRIGRLNIEEDFYLQCKIIKVSNIEKEKQDNFIYEIAEATNAQKPIKVADLKANTPEQLKLRNRLRTQHVWYITKKGDKAPKEFNQYYEITKIDKVGKLSLAGVLQMPGSARSNPKRMYNDEYYYLIFGSDAREGVIADLLRIGYYYDVFLKTEFKNSGYMLGANNEGATFKNAKTFQLACISFLSKLLQGVFSYDEISDNLNNQDELKKILHKMGNMKKIIINRPDTEEEEKCILFSIFGSIGDEVIQYCYENEIEKDKNIMPSNYLKQDTAYYMQIIPRLWKTYKKGKDLQKGIIALCEKKR